MDGSSASAATFELGWRCSESLWSIAGTDSCPARHSGYLQSGPAAHQNDDGHEVDLGPRTSEGGDPDGGQVAHGQHVGADGDSTVALEPVDAALDRVAAG
jgi:hypothetical protein